MLCEAWARAEGGGRRAGRGGGTLGADMSSVYARILLDDDQLLVVGELDVAALRLARACLQGLHLFDGPATALLVHVFLAAASVVVVYAELSTFFSKLQRERNGVGKPDRTD